MARRRAFDPVQVEVWRHLLASVAEEMGATLERTAYSPNIKERLDHSCALFDAEGRLLAQAAHIPVHLGAMPLMLESLRTQITWRPGEMWLCNDPRFGGTHLPDLTLVAPVFQAGVGCRVSGVGNAAQRPTTNDQGGREKGKDERRKPNTPYQPPVSDTLLGFVASRAHHADIGGLSPGSLPLSTELCHEGIILPPVRLVIGSEAQEEIIRLVCANSRTPAERRGDLAAQIAANETGIRRFLALVARYGLGEFRRRTRENIAYAAAAVRNALTALPPGTYPATDLLDDDGAGQRDIPIRVTMTLTRHGNITFDFSGSAPQVRGSLNATEAITRSACYYIVRCLVEEEIPTNAGCFDPVRVIAPEGTIVNARFPAPVAGGNVETSQRITDVLLRALAQAAPDRIPAASQGTMNNITIGGYDPIRNRPFAYYETIAGGAGASPLGAGASAVHTHMTNTRNTPVETLESHYPLRVLAYRLAENTGGDGKHCGGNGLVRRLELLSEAQISLLTERREHPPFGVHAKPGECGAQILVEPHTPPQLLPAKWSGLCPPGSLLTLQTPGGGGWSPPNKNNAEG
jgi:N-methylhydantoinase B